MPRLVFCTRLLFAAFAPGAVARAQGPEIVVDRDDVDVATSCRVRIPAGVVVADANRDGVVRVVADDVVLTFVGETLRGAPRNAAPETFEGFAVRVVGRRGVRLQGLRAAGYRAALYASRADGLVLSDADVSDNRAQRLRSDARRCDDGADWLAPHDNDRNEWLERYGAGAYVEDSRGVAVENLRCRRTQNGVVFDRVDASRVADCDASFLSGWGLALWRSSDNLVSRNAFDFCVRGYSHGVYNRGQDSAGVLLFEQCSRNRFLENSITHGGDGVFGFAGKEALGDAPPPAAAFDYRRRGCNDNVFVGNDLSYAAAHGLELTFSFGARIEHNRFAGNAICGVWAGYSQDMVVARNAFSENGGAGYGLERGGVNVEHGAGNLYAANTFV
ncbi:MAG TPA: right-handed parallel beta-helix repeat-containing protein [Planctomycetota bacterium]|nr:right-handed parallel beta-helix repeat-containing protein [Planctomycetota bacterium]